MADGNNFSFPGVFGFPPDIPAEPQPVALTAELTLDDGSVVNVESGVDVPHGASGGRITLRIPCTDVPAGRLVARAVVRNPNLDVEVPIAWLPPTCVPLCGYLEFSCAPDDLVAGPGFDRMEFFGWPVKVAEQDEPVGCLPAPPGTPVTSAFALPDLPPNPACTAGHVTSAGGENIPGIQIEDNQHEDCFSIRYTDPDSGEQDVIHFCDWPALKAAIDKHQSERGGKT